MADEIVVVAVIPVAEGKRDDAVAALTQMAETVHREEPGVLRYALHSDVKDPNRLVMVEAYASQADFDAHGKTAHMAEMGGKLGGVLAGRPEITVLTPIPGGDATKGVIS